MRIDGNNNEIWVNFLKGKYASWGGVKMALFMDTNYYEFRKIESGFFFFKNALRAITQSRD